MEKGQLGPLVILRTTEPSRELADIAQPIGYAAWRSRLETRDDADIRHMFDPGKPEQAERLLKRMREKAGQFVGVVATATNVSAEPVGYAWAVDDMSGGTMAKLTKRVLGRKPYTWVAQINVIPKLQGQGIGTAMLQELMRGFPDERQPTAYVFDENQLTLGWFRKLGFNPKPEQPVPQTLYFGEDRPPVMQWRLVATSTASVEQEIKNYYPNLPEFTVKAM